MKRAYEEAFAEIDEILKTMPIDLLSKIPVTFRQVISENKAKDYVVKIEEPLQEEKLKKETIVMLGLIYRDFLASPEERDELQKQDAEQLQKMEQEMQEQYDIQNVFEKRKNNTKQQDTTDLTLYKEPGFFGKVINFFKGIFKKNKF